MPERVDQYAVFGNPVAHSQSPLIHKLFAEQTGQSLSYTRQLVEPGHFAEAVRDFAAHNGKGLNITVPYKHEAWELADQLSERARRAGAVNTIKINDNSYFGDNTDGVGLVRDLVNNHSITIEQSHVLILGAGGAVSGVIEPILNQNPARLIIANRTVEKALNLAHQFSDLGTITGCALDDPIVSQAAFNVVINGTSASLKGELPSLPTILFSEQGCAYDMMYAAEATPFMKWAIQNGAITVCDGLGMLVEQAAESFYIWRHARPETKPVIDAIRQALSATS